MTPRLTQQRKDAENVPRDTYVDGPKSATQDALSPRRRGLLASLDPMTIAVVPSTLCPHGGAAAPPPE